MDKKSLAEIEEEIKGHGAQGIKSGVFSEWFRRILESICQALLGGSN